MMKSTERVPLQSECIYHIFNQGNNRENLFLEEGDYISFLERYKKYISPIANTLAFALLPNHYHFLLQIKSHADLYEALPERFLLSQEEINSTGSFFFEEEINLNNQISKNLSLQFSDYFNSYAQSFNRKHNRKGKLFSLPFKKILVDNEKYFTYLICYIHRNAIHHGFCNHYHEWPFSSYNNIVFGQSDIIDIDFIIEWFGTIENFKEIHEEERKKFFSTNPNRVRQP